MFRVSALLFCFFVVFTSSSLGQSNPAPENQQREPIKIVMDGARKPGDCMSEARTVHDEVQHLVFPSGWTIAVICTPLRWEQLMRQIDEPKLHLAFTRMKERITVVNGAIFHEFPPNYHHILAHELGHIRCGGCRDEERADLFAAELERDAERAQPKREAVVSTGAN